MVQNTKELAAQVNEANANSTELFRAIKVAIYVKEMSRRGINTRRLLAGTGVDAKRVAAMDYLINSEQYQAVITNMLTLTGDPGVAFSLSELADPRELGIVGYAMASASTLWDVIDTWCAYSTSLVGIAHRGYSYRPCSPGYEISLWTPMPDGALRRFEIEQGIRVGLNLLHTLTGVSPVLGGITLAYPAPTYRALYDSAFKCPITFDAPATTLRLLAPDLETSIRTMNEEIFSVCTQHCRQIMKTLPGAGPLRVEIRNLFLKTPSRLPDLHDAGAALGISSSTLRRKLDASGQSYQDLKDEFRFDLAREYLRTGYMAPKQVAYLLGFTTSTAFSRAFKQWSGQTPTEFQIATTKQNK